MSYAVEIPFFRVAHQLYIWFGRANQEFQITNVVIGNVVTSKIHTMYKKQKS